MDDRTASRFWSKVSKGEPTECWPWIACRDVRGYGRFWVAGDITTGAHRAAYELTVGPIPATMTIDHLCRNTSCVNPAHLEVVTKAENVSRVPKEVRRAAGKKGTTPATHCKYGHEFTPTSTGWAKPREEGGYQTRYCLICRSDKRDKAGLADCVG